MWLNLRWLISEIRKCSYIGLILIIEQQRATAKIFSHLASCWSTSSPYSRKTLRHLLHLHLLLLILHLNSHFPSIQSLLKLLILTLNLILNNLYRFLSLWRTLINHLIRVIIIIIIVKIINTLHQSFLSISILFSFVIKIKLLWDSSLLLLLLLLKLLNSLSILQESFLICNNIILFYLYFLFLFLL